MPKLGNKYLTALLLVTFLSCHVGVISSITCYVCIDCFTANKPVSGDCGANVATCSYGSVLLMNGTRSQVKTCGSPDEFAANFTGCMSVNMTGYGYASAFACVCSTNLCNFANATTSGFNGFHIGLSNWSGAWRFVAAMFAAASAASLGFAV